MVTIFTIDNYWISVDGGWQRARKRLYKNFRINARTSKHYYCINLLQDPNWECYGYSVEVMDSERLRVIRAAR